MAFWWVFQGDSYKRARRRVELASGFSESEARTIGIDPKAKLRLISPAHESYLAGHRRRARGGE